MKIGTTDARRMGCRGRRSPVKVVTLALLLIPACIDAAFQSQRHATTRTRCYGLLMRSEDNEDCPGASTPSTPVNYVDRRRFATSALSSFSVIASTRRTSNALEAELDEGRQPAPFLSGSCVIKSGVTPELSNPNAALYVTARPESLSSAPKSLFDMLVGNYGGKPPAVLTARYPISGEAPYEFQLSASDLTEEGSFSTSNDKSEPLWWQNDDLIISARLDSDGVASSRFPEDLVGRTISSAKNSRSGLRIELSGRGMFGKSVTRKK